jgi:hypothetical protein
MRPINLNWVFRLLGTTAVILVGVGAIAPRVRPAAEAQSIVATQLPLTTAYFYGPVSASANQMVKLCSNNLFGTGSARIAAAIIDATDGKVLESGEMILVRRGGDCLTFQPQESLDVLGVLWSLGREPWGEFNWSSARASGPLASLQLLDVATDDAGNVVTNVVGILNTAGKVTVDSTLLPAIQ